MATVAPCVFGHLVPGYFLQNALISYYKL